MKSGMADDDSFAILADDGRMVAHAAVFDRKRVEVNPSGSYRGADALSEVSAETRTFAEAEARLLGMIDEP